MISDKKDKYEGGCFRQKKQSHSALSPKHRQSSLIPSFLPLFTRGLQAGCPRGVPLSLVTVEYSSMLLNYGAQEKRLRKGREHADIFYGRIQSEAPAPFESTNAQCRHPADCCFAAALSLQLALGAHNVRHRLDTAIRRACHRRQSASLLSPSHLSSDRTAMVSPPCREHDSPRASFIKVLNGFSICDSAMPSRSTT